MFKKVIAAQTMLAALLLFTSPALAEGTRGGEKFDKPWSKNKDCDKTHKKGKDYCDKTKRSGGKRHFDILKLADKLGLDEEQVARTRKLKMEHKKEKIMLKADLDILNLELKELKHDYDSSIKSVNRKIREVEAKEGDLEIARYKLRRDISDILTSEQREQLKAIYMEMRPGRK